MSLKTEKDKEKQLQDKCQSVLNALLRDDDNKYCVDCDSKGPRWASWNIGVFLCIRCAGIHRNLGVHISRVKSVNLDSWTPEQVVSMQQMGNSAARAVYEANLPDNFRRPQSDMSLESFIRAKYQQKKYIAKEWVVPPAPKVNWEKEIDEEIERQKRKKKTILEKKPLANVEVPQLPKPTNPSPKPNRLAPNKEENKEKEKTNSDLLGLQNGEDSFSNFISASPAQITSTEDSKNKNETADIAKSEEESFFNQTIPTEKEKVKLDKNSILALYGNAPMIPAMPQNAFDQFQVPMQVPYSGGFPVMQGPMQNNFQAFGGFAQGQQGFQGQQAFQGQNGMTALQGQFGQVQGGAPAAPSFQNWNNVGAVQNQMIPNQFPGAAQFQNVQQHAVGLPNVSAQIQPQIGAQNGHMSQQANFPQLSKPFFNNQTMPLQHQFGNLSLGPGAAAPAGTASQMSTNIWQ